MKILACTDGSEQSKKALEKAAEIAGGCDVNEVAVIHVDDGKPELASLISEEGASLEQVDEIKKKIAKHNEEKENIINEASKIFEDKNIKVQTFLKEGHPSHTIVSLAREEGFDTIVTGSRGKGGLKKVFLGSVSNAVVQEAEGCTVIVVR